MRIRILSAIGGSPAHNVGDIVDKPEGVARAWIAEGIAEAAEELVSTAVDTTPVETAVRGRRR